METFSALLAICAGNSPVPSEFPAQRPVTQSFDVFFDLRVNKRLRKQLWGLKKIANIFADNFFKCIFCNENHNIFYSKGPIENKSALFR